MSGERGFPGRFVPQCHPGLLRLLLQGGCGGAAAEKPFPGGTNALCAGNVPPALPVLFAELGHKPSTVSSTALVSQMEIIHRREGKSDCVPLKSTFGTPAPIHGPGSQIST